MDYSPSKIKNGYYIMPNRTHCPNIAPRLRRNVFGAINSLSNPGAKAKNKIDLLTIVVSGGQYHLVMLTEPWLHPHTLNSELGMPTYEILRRDHLGITLSGIDVNDNIYDDAYITWKQ